MKTIRNILAVLGIGLLLSGCATSQSSSSAFFPDWQPNIDQPIRQLEETLSKRDQQQPMNFTISNVAFLYDTKLYILFNDFIGQLPKSQRASELEEQRKWLNQRKKLIAAGYAEYEGGTLAAYNAGHISIDASKKRIAEIEKKMKGLPAMPSTVP